MDQETLVEELMDLIETRRLSTLLTALAKRCEEDRMVLLSSAEKDHAAGIYLSDEQNLLEATAGLFQQVEEESRSRD